MQMLGKDEFRAFLTKIGFDKPLATILFIMSHASGL